MNNRREGKLAFTFPGQGSFNADVLRELFESARWQTEFRQAQEACRLILGHDFLPLVESRSQEEREQILKVCPDLDQVGIYVADYLTAAGLIDAGLTPDLLLGHSFGEMAALAVAGCLTFETGLRIVCQRSAILTHLASGGRMAAVSCNSERALDLIRGLKGSSLEIAVINHKRQTVVSGLPAELERLRESAAGQGVSLTLLKSRHPFHSTLLKPVVEPFRLMLCGYAFKSPAIPVYLCTERKFLSAAESLPSVLSEQFFKQLDFSAILNELHGLGFRRFVECGAGNIVTKVTQEAGLEGIETFSSAPLADGPEKGRAAILRELSQEIGAGKPQATPQLAELIRDMHAVLGRASRAIEDIAADNGAVAVVEPARQSEAEPEPVREPEQIAEPEPCDAEPIAIVGIGCVLPGAQNPAQYWSNILAGFSGITDLGDEDPTSALDFLGGSAGPEQKIVSDKTYTQLSGYAGTILYDADLLSSSYSRAEFERLTRAEKLLAMASAQAFAGKFKAKLSSIPADRIECVLGATADGSNEYDCAVFEESLEGILAKVEADTNRRSAFAKSLRRIWGEPAADNPRAAQSDSCRAVIESTAGRPIRTYVIDAACSSSLYAIGLGVTALQDCTKDVMLVGGVFAPAQANSALFAQFRGLSPNASRPFDVSADGVIFGEGSGLLVLKRLSDAMAAGDPVIGVVRGVGVSSDGKSPAINVPQSKGQSMAIRRAYDASHIDVNSIQYVEAHATATPVGDAVEFGALVRAISRKPELPRIELGSVKALIGHTGWAAGVASVIKLCKAFENRTIPPQYNYSSPNPQINLNASPFHISTTASEWPANSGMPRRAAINGFGFGGTNAHVILEEYHPAYHARLCAAVKPKAVASPTLAVIDAAALFPSVNGFEKNAATAQQEFTRALLRLPKGQRLLPDVTEHMDPGQYLALLAAEQVLPALGDRLKELRDEIGIVIGVESKTERGIHANQRIFLDRLKRKFAEDSVIDGIPLNERAVILDRLCSAVTKGVIPSGPYTLPGLMPNVISGRVANMFELHGPNVVIDMGSNSLFQSLMVARDFLMHGECKAVLAGGLNAVRATQKDAEAAFLAILTTEATARELNLPIACLLTVNGSSPDQDATATPGTPSTSANYRGVQGAIELTEAIARVREGQRQVVVREQQSVSALARDLVFQSAQPEAKLAPATAAVQSSAAAPSSGTYAYVQNTPIYYYTPVETAAPLPAPSLARRERRILFLTDQPAHWRQLEKSGALSSFDYHVICAHAAPLARSTPIDLANEDASKAALGSLPGAFDTVVAVKFSGEGLPDSFLNTPLENVLGLPDLSFAVCRQFYEQFQTGAIAMGSLCLGAFIGGRLNPFSGLLAGFVKSLARELPAAVCRSLNVDQTDFRLGMARLDAELSHRDKAVEVCYRDGSRYVIELSRLERPSQGDAPLLNSNSVVLATGGGRGVTAVLTEELLTRFGCTVVALGRTNPATAPAAILRMSAAQLANYEQEFYKTELAKGGVKITELKNRFRSYQAAHEVNGLVQTLSALPGRFEYVSGDITSDEITSAVVESIFKKYGRLDMVLHGAGIQISKVLTRKTVADYHSVVAAKTASLQHIYRACEKHRAGRPVHYHLLTSAFSYMGNDGQPDYGAVNESLNRLADVMSAAPESRETHSQWCSVAWLGWAGIGMTRGSEFAALAASRGLRGVTRSEGREIFSHFLTGQATAPINILMADGELKFYDVATTSAAYVPALRTASPRLTRKDKLIVERTVTADGAPYILNHCVDGIPTLPGAFLIMMIAEAALELRPDLKITAFEDAAFRKFVRLRKDGPTQLRLNASIVSEDDESTLIRVEVVSDFMHKSGKVLQKDVVQTEMSVRMGHSVNRARVATANGSSSPKGRVLSDPYVMHGSPVHLNGPFRTLNNIVVGESNRSAEYRLTETSGIGSGGAAFLSSLMVMDSLWRFGAIDLHPDNTLPVYVPEACKIMKVYFDLGDPGVESALSHELSMTGSNPTADRDRLTIGPVEVRDPVGSVLLTVDGGVCRRMGEVRNGHH
ncbi:MAG TPA: SDR family NAD(P)-dependent oxidoreductase [Terracidiphilus sp.]|nr:SDR family NAD(P)-dependent oxidoreductase [Terracidiphilus sp.]